MSDKQETSMTFVKQSIAAVSRIKDDFNEAQLKFVKGLINPDLTDSELFLFLTYAEKTQLNPFNKEIISVVYGKNTPDRRVNTITTRDGKRVVATRTGELDMIVSEAIYIKPVKNGEPDTFVKCEPWEGKLWGARCTVTRKGKSYTSLVPLSEYDTNKSVWITKKSTMIKKVAESQSLSMAFPEVLGGIYDESEMSTTPIEVKTVPTMDGAEDPATEAQLKTLRTLGLDEDQIVGVTKQTAAEMIAKAALSKKG